MRKKWIIFGISLLVIINLSALATMGYHRWCRYRVECRYRKIQLEEKTFYQQLSLSNDQIEKMKTCRQSFLTQADQINSVLHQKRSELVDLLITSEPDSERIHIVLNHIDSMQAELHKSVIYYLLKEKELLTPEQQEKFFSIIKERILQDGRHHQVNGLDPLENGCNVKCQEAKEIPKKDERR